MLKLRVYKPYLSLSFSGLGAPKLCSCLFLVILSQYTALSVAIFKRDLGEGHARSFTVPPAQPFDYLSSVGFESLSQTSWHFPNFALDQPSPQSALEVMPTLQAESVYLLVSFISFFRHLLVSS